MVRIQTLKDHRAKKIFFLQRIYIAGEDQEFRGSQGEEDLFLAEDIAGEDPDFRGSQGEEDLFLVEDVAGEDPEASPPHVHGQLLGVRAGHRLPGPGQHAVRHLVADVEQDGVHAGKVERTPRPELVHVDQQVHGAEQEEGHGGGGKDKGEGPQVFIHRDDSVILGKSAKCPSHQTGQYRKGQPPLNAALP